MNQAASKKLMNIAFKNIAKHGGGAIGAMVGSNIAASSVTVLGSQTLGAAALSLGLISAPFTPVIVGGAVGLIMGISLTKMVLPSNKS